MVRSGEAAFLRACVAFAAIVLVALGINTARVGSAIAREVQRVQFDYLRHAGGGEPAEANAVLLGRCVRSEMLKSARDGLVRPDAWAIAARREALPFCAEVLRPETAPRVPVPRTHAFVTRAPHADAAMHRA